MSQPAESARRGAQLLDVYDSALPYVYGYLLHRCGGSALAEDLTAQTMLAAVDAVRRNTAPPLSVPWLIGVARHKLVDHWRRQAREERFLRAMPADDALVSDTWTVEIDAVTARAVLSTLAPHHQAVLTLRYLDDLPVARVAEMLDRSQHATEGLLARARAAFRRAYGGEESGHA